MNKQKKQQQMRQQLLLLSSYPRGNQGRADLETLSSRLYDNYEIYIVKLLVKLSILKNSKVEIIEKFSILENA